MSAQWLATISLLLCIAVSGNATGETRVSIEQGRWLINGQVVNHGSVCEGLLMNVRMVNATFEDRHRPEFDAEKNADRFIAQIPAYAGQGVNAVTLCLQGGMPGYEGALNSAFEPDGSLLPSYMARVERVIKACDAHGLVVILGLYYQRQSKVLQDEQAVRSGVVNTAKWIRDCGLLNVVVEIANEYPHNGFAHSIIRSASGQASLIRLCKETVPNLLVTASGYGDGRVHPEVAEVCDFLTPHWNGTQVADIAQRVTALKKHGKPIVCNEDDRIGEQAVLALRATVASGAGYGLMLKKHNQSLPFHFEGASDDSVYYSALHQLVHAKDERVTVAAIPVRANYFPPPESRGGWRQVENSSELETVTGMDATKIDRLRSWLLASDNRNFSAVVIRRGAIALQVERGNSAVTDTRRVASVSKAICATVLAIASERSQTGSMPSKMSFDDRAFDFIPWAKPLSDPRKSRITIRQLLNHTSGICPESLGAPNDGSWSYVLGHSGDVRTEKLAFDPGTACGYSTHGFVHASLVCETVTGQPYDQFAIEALFKPLGIENWWFQYYEGGEVGHKASHGLGLSSRDLARIGYCMLRSGRWGDQQIIPTWFVEQSGLPSTNVATAELRWKLNPQVFSLGWELPARHFPTSGKHIAGIPQDARYKPGSGGQLLAFVPSLDLVIARQTGSSGNWDYEEFLRLACDAAIIK